MLPCAVLRLLQGQTWNEHYTCAGVENAWTLRCLFSLFWQTYGR